MHFSGFSPRLVKVLEKGIIALMTKWASSQSYRCSKCAQVFFLHRTKMLARGLKLGYVELLTVQSVSNVFSETKDPSRPKRKIDA